MSGTTAGITHYNTTDLAFWNVVEYLQPHSCTVAQIEFYLCTTYQDMTCLNQKYRLVNTQSYNKIPVFKLCPILKPDTNSFGVVGPRLYACKDCQNEHMSEYTRTKEGK